MSAALPIGASLIARATYLARGIPSRVDAVDELAEARVAPDQARSSS